MSGKVEYKKTYGNLYGVGTVPVVLDVPVMTFALLQGEGDPNGPDFTLATEALYGFSYAVKMSYKSNLVPDGYYDYSVFPLEGVWDVRDVNLPSTLKNNFKYDLMIRQPDFLTEELFFRFQSEVKKKRSNVWLDRLKFVSIHEGLCCQILHVGRYDDEPASFTLMDDYCKNNGYVRIVKTHREIYLSDPRRVEAEKLKTILRYKVKKNS